MTPSTQRVRAWPTDLMFVQYPIDEVRSHNGALIDLVFGEGVSNDRFLEHRRHNLEQANLQATDWLVGEVKRVACEYIGADYPVSVSLRGVAIKHGQCINTHTETHESDLAFMYWPGGPEFAVGAPISDLSNPEDAPTFIVEDPSRHLTDLRLPFEERHSICIRPRPGFMIVGPAHMPHNFWPYLGRNPFVHIVAQVRFQWPDSYKERF